MSVALPADLSVMFTRRLYARPGPIRDDFPTRDPSFMRTAHNNIQVDASDGRAHANVGVKFITVHTTSIGDLVSMYDYFTKAQRQQPKGGWPSFIARVAYVLTSFVGKTRGLGETNPYKSM
ncbi:hypothetical protein K438DRAFT_1757899 [Mycena galopus ATCC 62051]|nr:hypothetical protein K438DRAFT_1786993 [Mycena galopus ATCC 62051]KAF8203588.1 hypothetical protein K438DRAFT_1757899 [Mycena galopus ATCC 62051]